MAMAVIELTPGPNMGWLAALSAQSGKKAGFYAVGGITLGLFLQIIAAATGLSAITLAWPALYETLRWAGVIFMVYLAWDAWQIGNENSPASGRDQASFTRGLIANILNPKALMFYVIIIGQFIQPESTPIWLQILILGLIHLSIAFIVHMVIVLLGSELGDKITKWQHALPVRLTFAGSLLLIAVWVAFSTARN